MRGQFRLKRWVIPFSHDMLMVPLAWLGAFWLRFNMDWIPHGMLHEALLVLPLVLTTQALAFYFFGLYRGMWRFASMADLVRIVKAVLAGGLVALCLTFFFTRMSGLPRSVWPLYGLLLIMMLGGSRFFYRWLRDYRQLFGGSQRVLIVGAGQAGEMLVRELAREGARSHRPIVFVDDDPKKRGQDIHGIRVAGALKHIPKLVTQHNINLVVIAMAAVKSSVIREVVALCDAIPIECRTIPGLNDLMTGKARIQALRDISLEDLLGRDPVSLDWNTIADSISGKKVLISGGGGSIGSELCRQVAQFGPQSLIVLDCHEFNLYQIDRELNEAFPTIDLQCCLIDVVDQVAVEGCLQRYQPDMVFHAAAYKHVPLLESQLRVAIRNNVQGTRCMAEASVSANVKTFVLISTDKAVNPTNVMGASKRAAEVFCQNLNATTETNFMTVRFGNVLGSAGSVVPLFREQLAKGGPLTVTHREITRYFMTIPEAAQLILQATVIGEGGEIFVLDMGQPIKISDLAHQMIRLSGKKVGEDIEVIYTGLRPGEKLHEELFHEGETLTQTQHAKIHQAHTRKMPWPTLIELLDQLAISCTNADDTHTRHLLGQLVPEWGQTVTWTG